MGLVYFSRHSKISCSCEELLWGEAPKFKVMIMAKQKIKGKIIIDRELCKGCSLCVPVCPSKVITVSEKLNKKGYSPAEFKENIAEGEKGCTGCAMCATICPEIAIEVYRAK